MRTCFVSIDVERDNFGAKNTFHGVENLNNILDIFRKHNVGATLFFSGQVLEHYPELVRVLAKNYEIGCHNHFHKPLDELDLLERERQLKRFVKAYKDVLGKYPQGFRAPRNIIDNQQFGILERHNFVYDSSVIPRHPFFHKYKGYKGRAPLKPYHPSLNNYRKEGTMRVAEIPSIPLFCGIPFAATWIRRLGVGFFKFLFILKKPDFLGLTMHSWDGIKFEGKSSRNSGEKFLKQLDEMLEFLKKMGYEFKSGEKIYGEFCKNK